MSTLALASSCTTEQLPGQSKIDFGLALLSKNHPAPVHAAELVTLVSFWAGGLPPGKYCTSTLFRSTIPPSVVS